MGDFSVFDYTRLKACQLADLAPTSNPSGRRKKSGVSIRSTSLILSADAVSILMSVFGCHFSMHRFIYLAFAATSILKCITRWRARRRRTKTTKKQQLAFIRDEESDSSPPSCGLYVEISRASLAPMMNALFPNIQKFVLYGTN